MSDERVESLFHEALALDAGARKRFLDERRPDEPSAVAEVERLLDELAEVPPGFLEGAPAVASRVPAPSVGTAIGRYLVVEEIGRGGMGVVLKARDPVLDRPVALKLVRPDARDLRFEERLLREAQTIARIAHPNVVTVFDAGRFGDCVFVAMELVEGVNLAQWLDAPRTLREVLEAFAAMADGVAAAHAAGVVHGDLKPANVLVGNDGRIRVTDFGLARWTHTVGVSRREGELVGGTPGYTAPEQTRGGVPSVKADQYAFFVALFEALLGTKPSVNGVSSLRGTPGGWPTRVLTSRRRPPSWVRGLLRSGLAPEPEQRHESMRSVARLLRQGISRSAYARLPWSRCRPSCRS